jgi:hypothetical protein
VEEAPEQSNALFSFQDRGVRTWKGARCDGNTVRGPEPPEAVCRSPAKDAADEHFLPVGAAPQQEQIADPKVWDQIRSRKAVITFHCQNSVKE